MAKDKPFIDYLPEWLNEIDLEDPANYKYAFAVKTYHRLREAMERFPQGTSWGQWIVEDKLGVEPKRYFPCWRSSEHPRWTPDIDELFPAINDRTDVDPVEMNGQVYKRFRYSVGVGVLEPYAPESPAVLAQRAEKRVEKQLKAEVDSMPLFSIEVKAAQAADGPTRKNAKK